MGKATQWASTLSLAIAALLTAPAASAATLVAGYTATRVVIHEGTPRTYRVRVPVGITPSSGILVALHGGLLGNAQQFEKGTRFATLAEQYNFIAVFPQGVVNTWNAGDCCGPAQSRNVDDVGFIAAVIADVRARDGVQGPAYATGISNGGMMAYRLACERPDLVSGIAPVASTLAMAPAACHPAGRVSLLHIHGLQDGYVPYDGGFPTDGFNKKLSRVAVGDSVNRWSQIDGCAVPHPSLARSQRPGEKETASTGCVKPVRLVTLQTAGHTWPGDPSAAGGALVDPAYPGYDASARILKFFGLVP